MFNVKIAIIFQLSGGIDLLAGLILAIFTADMGRISGLVIAGIGLLLFWVGRLMLNTTKKKSEPAFPIHPENNYQQSSALFR